MHPFLSLPILLAVVAGVAFALLGLSYKVGDRHGCRPLAFIAIMLCSGMAIAFVGTCREPAHWGDPRLWLLGVANGVMSFCALSCLLRANVLGPASITWTITNLALLVPILVSAVLFGEPLSLVDQGLIVLFILMLLAFVRGTTQTGETDARRVVPYLLTLGALFLTNGVGLLMNKMKAEVVGPGDSGTYSVLAFGSGAVLAVIAYLLREKPRLPRPAEWRMGTLAGSFSALGTLAVLGAMSLPAVVVFPIAQGIGLLGGVLLTILLFHERMGAMKAAGLILGMLVLLLAIFRDPLSAYLLAHPLAMPR